VIQAIFSKFTFMKKITLFLFLLSLIFTKTVIGGNGIHFTKNKGQWESPILFKATLSNGALFVEKNAFTYNFYNADEYKFHRMLGDVQIDAELKFHAYKIHFKNANTNPTIAAKNVYPFYYNYFLGKDESKWKSNVKSYSLIHYNDIYKNIDLTLYTYKTGLKYDVIVNPGGNPKSIQFEYEGTDNLTIDQQGNLHITTSINEIIEQKPFAYQLINGVKTEIPCEFVLKNNVVSFKLKSYNKKLPLIIDPVLIFASYSGSTADNFGMTATYGYDGSLFAGGTAFNIGYPTTIGAFDPNFNGTPASGITDVVITRYDSTGTNLSYSTYIGGVQAETVHSIIADSNNQLYIYGVTSSNDFPVTTGAYDETFNGGTPLNFPNNGTTFNIGTDIYVAKINSTGSSLLGCTYIGGTANDGVNHKAILTGNAGADYDSLMHNYGDQYRGEIMIDDIGNCYITSSTKSTDFPTLNAFDNTLDGHQDAVVFKFNPDLTSLFFSSYLGGSQADAGFSIKVDTSHFVYVCGGTSSSNFPTTPGAITTTYQGDEADGYITKIDSNGSSILASTFIGTANYDQAYFLDIDRFGSIYVTGQTQGVFPIINAPYANAGSGQYIMRVDNSLTTIDYSTLFGNGNINAEFSPSAFLVDRCENVYVSGWGGNILGGSALTNMPTTSNATQPNSGDGFNFYLFVLERNAQSMLYGTYFGGSQSSEHVDGGTSRFDKNGIVYQSVCAGCWSNDDFPTTPGAWSNTNNSTGCNNGIFKFDFEIVPKAEFAVDTFQGCAPLTITFSNSSGTSDTYLWDFGNGDTTSLEFNPVRTYSVPGVYYVSLLIQDSICNTVDTAFQTITVSPPVTITGGNTITTCDTATLSISSTGGPVNYIWSTNNQFSDTLNPNLSDTSFFITLSDTTKYYVMATNGICFAIDSFLVNYTGFQIQANDSATCQGNDIVLQAINNSDYTLTYSWTPTISIISGANTATPTVNPNSTITYTVVAQNSFGCIASDTAQVIVSGFNPNQVNITSDQDTLFGGSGTYLHVTPNTGFDYLWDSPPLTGADNIISSDPYVQPTTNTSYCVTMKEQISGCTFKNCRTIYIYEINCKEPNIFLPNAFTPNGDNENDVLFIRGKFLEKISLKIYDRWGELVFETDKQSIGWDGTFKGRLVEPAVYVFHLNVTCIDGQEYFKKGNVTVIR